MPGGHPMFFVICCCAGWPAPVFDPACCTGCSPTPVLAALAGLPPCLGGCLKISPCCNVANAAVFGGCPCCTGCGCPESQVSQIGSLLPWLSCTCRLVSLLCLLCRLTSCHVCLLLCWLTCTMMGVSICGLAAVPKCVPAALPCSAGVLAALAAAVLADLLPCLPGVLAPTRP